MLINLVYLIRTVKTFKPLRQSWENSFPVDGIDIPQSDLKNRDPSGEGDSFTDWVYSVFTPDINFGDGAKDNEDLSAFEKLPPLPPAQDPLTHRAPKQTLHKKQTSMASTASLAFLLTMILHH